MKQVELAQKLGISKSYLSMVLNGESSLTPELAEKLQQIPGVHKLVNTATWERLYTQGVRSSRISVLLLSTQLCVCLDSVFLGFSLNRARSFYTYFLNSGSSLVALTD